MGSTRNTPAPRQNGSGLSRRLGDFTPGPRGPNDPRQYRAGMGSAASTLAGPGLKLNADGKLEVSGGATTLYGLWESASVQSRDLFSHALMAARPLPVRTLVSAVGAGTFVLTPDDVVVFVNTANVTTTITLSRAAGRAGHFMRIKRVFPSAGCTVQPASGEQIDGSTGAISLFTYEALDLVSDGSNWWVF